jgi:DnaJ-domain-containing protein 1
MKTHYSTALPLPEYKAFMDKVRDQMNNSSASLKSLKKENEAQKATIKRYRKLINEKLNNE